MLARAKKLKDEALAKVAVAKKAANKMQGKAHTFAKKAGLVKNKDRTAAGKERLAKLKAKEDMIKRAKYGIYKKSHLTIGDFMTFYDLHHRIR